MKKTNIFMIIALIVIIVLIAALGYGYYKKATLEIKNPIVTMEVAGYGTIKLELYPEMAPNTVANFVNLVQNGYYNNVTFHRIVKDFMIQGGGNRAEEREVTDEETGEKSKEILTESISPKLSDLGIKVKDEKDNKTYCIKGEFTQNGFNKNTLRHEEGVLSMARADYTQSYSASLTEESYNSGSAQFFIMTKDNTYLDGSYAAFGKVIEGMDVVHAIEGAKVQPAENEGEEASTPIQSIIIKTVTVDTQGAKYKKPQTLEPFNYNTWVLDNYGTSTNS